MNSVDLHRWQRGKIESGEMPPTDMPRPGAAGSRTVTDWLQAEVRREDKLIKPDPGHITARHLNRAEYNNTVSDLLGVDFHPADDFPHDDSAVNPETVGDSNGVVKHLAEL